MNNSAEVPLTIVELPSVLTALFVRAHRPLLPGARGPLGLFVRYLRRKPARGLAVVYIVDEIGSKPTQRKSASAPDRSVSLTLDEEALSGAHIRFSTTQAHQAPLEVRPSGVIRVANLGLAVQAFPADDSLPALAASCDTEPQGSLFLALEVTAQVGDCRGC